MSDTIRNLARDPRHFQIAALASLLTFGTVRLGFPITPGIAIGTVATAIATQLVCTRLVSLPHFDARSPLITAFSVLLLLRTDSMVLWPLAAALSIASKFVIRHDGKHLFNPANFGIAATVLVTRDAWVSPGQWGNSSFLLFLFLCLGGMVVHRALRSDVALGLLGFWTALHLGRALWLGDPLAIPLHRLQNGALLLFAFFMISDPKTTPDRRSGRLIFAAVVALIAYAIQFRLWRGDALIWALLLAAPLTPLIDRLLPDRRYQWPALFRIPIPSLRKETLMRTLIPILLVTLLVPDTARAFCGFYVAKADTGLFNQASQVAIVRDGDRTVLTMANDFRGDPGEFAIVIPVPTVLQRKQINVADKALLDHLDAYTSPRLVEYFDENPCQRQLYKMDRVMPQAVQESSAGSRDSAARSLGVTIEASYTVGEYDILILSANESRGLETWLRDNGYRLPRGASRILDSYLRQDLKFFVAKVNLDERKSLGFTYLRPLQIAFESRRFMLPIRLGTLNANGPQELFIYTLTKNGRVESTNYRTVKLPTGTEIPTWVRGEFADFYRAMFSEQVRREAMRAVFLEYAWDMAWCDPCAADPLSADELRRLGVFWLDRSSDRSPAQNVFVTRLHVRYDATTFPDDLMFHETSNRENFQARYVLRHPWTGDDRCPAADQYRRDLTERQHEEARALARLTGWELDRIRRRMNIDRRPASDESWWDRLWSGWW